MTLVIELRGLEVHGFHGVLEEERRVGQRFLIDLELEPVDDVAAASDRIEDAVDYREVVGVVQEVSSRATYRLLEAFATTVADELLDRLPLRRARVRVRKPDVLLPAPVEHAAVVVERRSPAQQTGSQATPGSPSGA